MKGDSWEKLSVLLVVLGFVMGGFGAVLGFAFASWMLAFFYLGFLMAILGFAIAVLHKLRKTEKK